MLFYHIYWLNYFLALPRISMFHCAACHAWLLNEYMYVLKWIQLLYSCVRTTLVLDQSLGQIHDCRLWGWATNGTITNKEPSSCKCCQAICICLTIGNLAYSLSQLCQKPWQNLSDSSYTATAFRPVARHSRGGSIEEPTAPRRQNVERECPL